MHRTIINPIYKDTITFLQTTKETGGDHSLHLLTLQPGGSNPPHIHTAFTETFTAVEGILGLQLRNKKVFLRPGESYVVQRNELHNFFNPNDKTIVFRVKFLPGHEGMEYALRIVYGLAWDGKTTKKGMPKSLFVAALLMDMSNSYMTGLATVLRPLLGLLAKRARNKGIDKVLMQKYCR